MKQRPAITAWQPEQDRHRLALLGKSIEEAGEFTARAARCIIHGLDERDPLTGRLNRDELADEASDLAACFELLRETLAITPVDARVTRKANGYRLWHSLIKGGQSDG